MIFLNKNPKNEKEPPLEQVEILSREGEESECAKSLRREFVQVNERPL